MSHPIDVVQAYFHAMQGGPANRAELFALFADDAVYVEPFSGQTLTHEGRAAIEAYLAASWEQAPPDLELQVDRIDVDGDVVVSEWTCRSPALPVPYRGRDTCTVREGRIQRLEVEPLGDTA
ncbi:MAG: nuclear transport factor 2 family protein [Myxococcota bacterium]